MTDSRSAMLAAIAQRRGRANAAEVIHRQLEELGIVNRVVDSASIEVNRRHRRAKTDKLDVRKLLEMLVRSESIPRPNPQ